MKKAIILADDAMLNDLKRASEQEKKSLAPKPRFSFAGKFDSRRKDIAEKHEELLWAGRK